MTMRSLLISATLLAPLAAAGAQPPAPDAATMAQHQQERAAREQEMAQDLGIVLRLTPAQQPALTAWLQSMTPAPRDWHGRGQGDDGADAATTPEKLAADQQRMAARQAEASTRIAATQRFYAQLDPQQRTVFDALDRLRKDEHHEMHGHGMRGRGGPGGGRPGDMPPGAPG